MQDALSIGLTLMNNGRPSRRQLDQLYDFAEFARKILELYDNVRVTMTRGMLLSELHNRLRGLDGAAEHRRFQPLWGCR